MKHSMTDHERFHDALQCGRMQSVVAQFGLGSRNPAVLDELARLKVYADNSGLEVMGWADMAIARILDGEDPEERDRILSDLVTERLGDMRCLDCQGFFRAMNALTAFVGLDGPLKACVCVHCGSNVTEPLGCNETTNQKG